MATLRHFSGTGWRQNLKRLEWYLNVCRVKNVTCMDISDPTADAGQNVLVGNFYVVPSVFWELKGNFQFSAITFQTFFFATVASNSCLRFYHSLIPTKRIFDQVKSVPVKFRRRQRQGRFKSVHSIQKDDIVLNISFVSTVRLILPTIVSTLFHFPHMK